MGLKTQLMELYKKHKKIIFILIYSLIIIYIGLFINIILMYIIGGVVIIGCIGFIICFTILEYQIRKEEKNEHKIIKKEYKEYYELTDFGKDICKALGIKRKEKK